MKSIYHGKAAANKKLNGKLTAVLSCKCCVMFNAKWELHLKNVDRELKQFITNGDVNER